MKISTVKKTEKVSSLIQDFKSVRLSQLTSIVRGGVILNNNMDLCVSNQNSFGELIKNGDLSIGANKRSDECSERFDSSDQCSESKKIQSFIEDKKVDYSKMQRFCYSYERKSGMLDYCWEPGPKVLILRFLFFTKIFFFEN